MEDLKSGDPSQAQKIMEVQNIAVMAQLNVYNSGFFLSFIDFFFKMAYTIFYFTI